MEIATNLLIVDCGGLNSGELCERQFLTQDSVEL